jgi:pimeloyl-ACP methyl ester carboxylesterase
VAQARRLLVRALILAASAGAASASYQRAAEARDRRRFPAPGRLVPVGDDRRLHLYEAGDGRPAVVIVPALNGSILEWLHIVREVQQDTLVCVYDRAGIGWSDPPPPGRLSLAAMAADLYALLGAAGVPPPYIVAGHSLGGVVARRFAADYPQQVCGLVMVDSSHDDQAKRISWRQGAGANLEFALRRRAWILGARRLAAACGLIPSLDADIAREAPPEYAGAARAISLSTQSRRITVAEMLLAARHRNQPADLGSLPLTVLTSASMPLAVWPQLQAELADLSTASRHIHAQRAGHNIHLDEPEAVIRALREMIRQCRS